MWRSLIGATDTTVYLLQPAAAHGGLNDIGWTNLIAVDAAAGQERWRTAFTGYSPYVPDGPIAAGGLVVCAHDDDTGHAIAGLDATTGALRWRVPGAADTAAVASSDDVVIVRGLGFLAGLDRATGTQLWASNDYGSGIVAVGADVAVVAGHRGAPVGLDVRTGRQRWTADTTPSGVPGRVDDDVLVWGGQDDPTAALDLRTGTWLWSDKPGHAAYDNVWAVGDGAAFVTNEGRTLAYDLRAGSVRWDRDLGPNEPWLVDGNDVIIAGSGIVVASTETGTPRWSAPPPQGQAIQGVAFGPDTIYAAFGTQTGD